jgi:carboxyl-terminal processing protease
MGEILDRQMKIFFLLVASGVLGAFGLASDLFAINCQAVRQLTGHYLRLHYSYHSFDDELSKRTLDNFIKAWDPGKVYFLASDIEGFQKTYGTQLDDLINDGNCSAIDAIINIYSKRFAERQAAVEKIIDSKHDFNLEESLEFDRKTLTWAATTEEVNERWRKRIKFQHLQLKEGMVSEEETRSKLHKRFQLAAKRHNELTSDDLYSIFLNSFSTAMDPHSDYLSPEQLEDFRIQTRLSLEGIGAVLRSEDGFTTIQSLVPGGAAAKTGLVKTDDKIVAVAQGNEHPVDVIDMDLREVVKLIRGARATEVRLSLVRQDAGGVKKIIAPIIREKIQLEDRAAKSYVYEVDAEASKGKKKPYRIGVVDLPSFYMDFEGRQAQKEDFKSSSVDMVNEIEKLKKEKIDAMVVDLRSNGGGSLDESIRIAGLFFETGPVVQIKGVNKSAYVSEDEDPKTFYDGPLIVLIDRQSASASEIFAGAIQDYQRGLIVGDSHSFGKGTVQNLNDLSKELGAIKVTISKFYRPNGGSTQLKGVESDIVLPSLSDHMEIGEKHYDYALVWDKIEASKHKDFNAVQPYVAALTKASVSRTAAEKEFKEMATSVADFEKKKEEGSKVSLKQKDAKDLKAESKDGKKKKKDLEQGADEDARRIPDLKDDLSLREAVRIATDYVRLIGKEQTVGLSFQKTAPVNQAVIVAAPAKAEIEGPKKTN